MVAAIVGEAHMGCCCLPSESLLVQSFAEVHNCCLIARTRYLPATAKGSWMDRRSIDAETASEPSGEPCAEMRSVEMAVSKISSNSLKLPRQVRASIPGSPLYLPR